MAARRLNSQPLQEADTLTVRVDGLAYGMSPYGGLITYWDAILSRLAESGIGIDLRLPARIRREPPQFRSQTPAGGSRWVFVSTYFTHVQPGMPSVVVVHDTIYEDYPDAIVTLGDDPDVLQRKAACIAEAAVVVTPSEASARSVRAHYPGISAPIVVIPHGVDPIFHAGPDPHGDAGAARLLAKHDIHGRYFLHVGGRRAYKNFSAVLTALAEHRPETRDITLVVAGSEPGPLPGEVDLIAAMPPGSVMFVGYIDRRILAGLYRLASVVICPSLAEGFGFVPVEAVASGTPVVCSDIPSHRETVGHIAHFFTPSDAQALLDAITRATSAAPAIRYDAARRSRETWNWARSAAAFKSVLELAAESSR